MAIDEKTLQPFGLGPQDSFFRPDDALLDGEDTVTMVFPTRVVLAIAGGKRIEFQAGTREVPRHLANHEWLARNGAEHYNSILAQQAIANTAAVSKAQHTFELAKQALLAAKAKAARDMTSAKQSPHTNMGASPEQPIDDGASPEQPIDDGEAPEQPIDDGEAPEQPIDDGEAPEQPNKTPAQATAPAPAPGKPIQQPSKKQQHPDKRHGWRR